MNEFIVDVIVKKTKDGKTITELVVEQEKAIATTVFGNVTVPYRKFVPCKLNFEKAKLLIGLKLLEIESQISDYE